MKVFPVALFCYTVQGGDAGSLKKKTNAAHARRSVGDDKDENIYLNTIK